TADRPEFQRLIADSEKRLFDAVLVWKLDRFSRDRYDSALYKHLLRKNGVKVISAKENISEGPEGIILEAMLEGYAEYYSAEGFKGRVGLISPITHKFCSSCNRIRLLSDGRVKPCLGYETAYDILHFIDDENKLLEEVKNIILKKPAGHSFGNGNAGHGLNRTGG
ncbi:MAG: recombinase family protein, partial [Clostridia bacterium]|nr:recombinase family protein [Clostridia bacterium]